MMATIDITKLSKDVLDYPDAEARWREDGEVLGASDVPRMSRKPPNATIGHDQ